MAKYGFSSLNSNLNRSQQGNFLSNLNLDLNQIRNNAVRVKDIVLDPNHPRFKEVGGWSGIGTIFYDSTTTGGQASSTGTFSPAKPMFSNLKFYPLINEVVAILTMVDPLESQNPTKTSSKLAFYFPPT